MRFFENLGKCVGVNYNTVKIEIVDDGRFEEIQVSYKNGELDKVQIPTSNFRMSDTVPWEEKEINLIEKCLFQLYLINNYLVDFIRSQSKVATSKVTYSLREAMELLKGIDFIIKQLSEEGKDDEITTNNTDSLESLRQHVSDQLQSTLRKKYTRNFCKILEEIQSKINGCNISKSDNNSKMSCSWKD